MRAMICSRLWAVMGRPQLRAMPLAHPGVEHPQVVVDLGDRSDRGARALAARFLRNRDRRAQPGDQVHVGLGHLAEELPGEARQALDVAPLSFGIKVSKANELFPDPLTPVKQISRLRGNTRSTSRRLCSRAPLMVISEAVMPLCPPGGKPHIVRDNRTRGQGKVQGTGVRGRGSWARN